MITLIPIVQRPLFRCIFSLALYLFIVVSAGSVAAAEPAVDDSGDQLLQDRAVQFMQQINQARRDPLAAAERLGIDEDLVRQAFADSPWILEQGLPPLAWNDSLVSSSAVHGRDMFQRLYYSYVSPDGETVEQRIAAEGYQPLFTGESMNALFFNNNYIPLDDAFEILVAVMLRDELRGEATVDRNIFSPDVTEIGVSLFAESLERLDEQPYVYLLLADFAAPVDNRRSAILTHDPDSRVVFHALVEDYWLVARLLRPGYSQVFFPEGGGDVGVIDVDGQGDVIGIYTLDDLGGMDNRNFNLFEPVDQ